MVQVFSIETIFIIHLMASLFMTGLCWFVQIVHYPLFRQIELDKFPAYEKKNFVTGFVTIPVMVIELGSALYLLYHNPESLYFLNVCLLGIIGLSTVIFQVPIHLKLSQKATAPLIDKLIRTNWIRTISWTIRMGILAILLSQSLVFS
ncbi:MAG: hypothetical protein Roseis3KO_45720 [Roseivirga sp.]